MTPDRDDLRFFGWVAALIVAAAGATVWFLTFGMGG